MKYRMQAQAGNFTRSRKSAGCVSAIVILAAILISAPSAIAAQALWIANTGSTNIEQFQKSQLKETGVPHPRTIALPDDPVGIAFDRKGNLWTTVDGTELVEFSARLLSTLDKKSSPTPSAIITSSSFLELYGCNFDSAGNLWVADRSQAIFKISSTQLRAGSASVVPETTLTATTYFSGPQFVAFDKAGDMWVSDEDADAVYEFTPSQLAQGGDQTPRVINHGLSDPGELAFDHLRNLWVANYGTSNVVEFAKADLPGTGDPDPAVTLTSSNNILDGAWGLAFDQNNNMWVAAYNTGSIVKYGPVQQTAKHPVSPKVFLGGAQNDSYQIVFGPAS